MSNQELSPELVSVFTTNTLSKLSNLRAIVNLCEKRGFRKPNLFGIQNAVLNLHSLAKTFEQDWISELFEEKIVRPLQQAVRSDTPPDEATVQEFYASIETCQNKLTEMTNAARQKNPLTMSPQISSTDPQYAAALTAIGQIGIWGYHEISGELTKIHGYCEMISNWIQELKDKPLGNEIKTELTEIARIQGRMKQASDMILEIIQRNRAARGKIKEHKEILLLQQVVSDILNIGSVKISAKWITENLPTSDIVVDKNQLEFLWISVVKLFADWLSPSKSLRAFCDAGVANNQTQKIPLYVTLEPQSEHAIQFDVSNVDFSHEPPFQDVGCVFETSVHLASLWEIDLDVGLNDRGHPVARFLLPLAGKQQGPQKDSVASDIKPKPPTTLIVDDDKDVATMLQKKLSRFGYPAIVATDLESARLVLTNQKIGAIIADLFLGEESGLTLLTTVKKQFPELKFIFITGATADDLSPGVAKLLAANADAALNKPIEDEILRSTLERLMPT